MPISAAELDEYHRYKIPNDTTEYPLSITEHITTNCFLFIFLDGDFTKIDPQLAWVDELYITLNNPILFSDSIEKTMVLAGNANCRLRGVVNGNTYEESIIMPIQFGKLSYRNDTQLENIYILTALLSEDYIPIAMYPETNQLVTPYLLDPNSIEFCVEDSDFYDDSIAVEFIDYFFVPESSGDNIVVDTDLVSHYTDKATILLGIIDLYFYQLSSKGPIVTVILIFVSFCIIFSALYFILSIIRRR